jgi:hypothetical protein
VAQAERAGRVTYYEREDHKSGIHHRFRFVCNMPLNASHPGLRVNFIECWEAKWGSKRLLWEKMRAYFYAYALESMRHLFEVLYDGLNKSTPILASDSG